MIEMPIQAAMVLSPPRMTIMLPTMAAVPSRIFLPIVPVFLKYSLIASLKMAFISLRSSGVKIGSSGGQLVGISSVEEAPDGSEDAVGEVGEHISSARGSCGTRGGRTRLLVLCPH